MRVVAVVQARMGSSRLPGKVILPLGRKSVLDQIFERLSTSNQVCDIVLATTDGDKDRPLRALAALRGWSFVAGSETDVLSRFVAAAERFGADHIVRVTADCPLVDVPGMDDCIRHHLETGADYTHNASDTGFERLPAGCALGLAVEVADARALSTISRFNLRPQHREHVTTLFLENPETFNVHALPARVPELAKLDLRLTLDTREDYEVLRRVYDALYRPDRPIDAVDAVRWLDAHPETAAINRDVSQLQLTTRYRVDRLRGTLDAVAPAAL